MRNITASKNNNKKWMQGAVEEPGSFRAYCKSQGLTDKEGNVTSACIEAAKKSKDPTTRKRVVLAETFAKHRPKSRSDLDAFDIIDDFPTYFGRIGRAGPYLYPEGIRYKKYDNLKELFNRIDHLPLYGSRVYGSHDEDKPTTELVGFLHNWVLNDEKKDIFSDVEYFKDIKELSDLKNPQKLPISLKFKVADPNAKVQDIRELIHAAVSLNKLELDRCSSVAGYGSCDISTKTSDFRDTNDSRTSSEIPGSDGIGYYIARDDWFDFMDIPDEAEQLIKNQKNIAKVEDNMGDNNKPPMGNPISKGIEECLKTGKTEEECKLALQREERTGKERVGNEQEKNDVKVPKKDFDKLETDFKALQKENEDLKASLEAYNDFEEEFVNQLKELEDFKEKMTKKEEKRKSKKLEDLVNHLKADHNTCETFVENHNNYDFLKEFHKGLPEPAKEKAENEDFVPSLADFGEKLAKVKEKYNWMVMD